MSGRDGARMKLVGRILTKLVMERRICLGRPWGFTYEQPIRWLLSVFRKWARMTNVVEQKKHGQQGASSEIETNTCAAD